MASSKPSRPRERRGLLAVLLCIGALFAGCATTSEEAPIRDAPDMRERHAWLVLDTARIDLDLSHTTSHDPETGFTVAGNSFPLDTLWIPVTPGERLNIEVAHNPGSIHFRWTEAGQSGFRDPVQPLEDGTITAMGGKPGA